MPNISIEVTNRVGEVEKTVKVEFRDFTVVEPLVQLAAGALTAVLSDPPQKSIVQPSAVASVPERHVLADLTYMLKGVKKRLEGGPLTLSGSKDLVESLDRCINTLEAQISGEYQ